MASGTQEHRKSGFLGGKSVGELGKSVWREVRDDNCAGQAAQLAFYLIFAAFPFLLFLATLLGYIPIPNLMDRIMEYLAPLLPGEALNLIRDNVHQLVTDQKGGLLSFGIAMALWTSSSAFVAIMDNLNRAYDVEEGRPFWKVRGIAILMTIGINIFIAISMVLLIFGPQIGGWIASQVGLGTVFQTRLEHPALAGDCPVAHCGHGAPLLLCARRRAEVEVDYAGISFYRYCDYCGCLRFLVLCE